MKKSGVFNHFSYFFALLAIILLLPQPVSAQVVDRAELGAYGPVEFINFEGPHTRWETRAQIRNIGYVLGRAIRDGNTRVGTLGRYFVINSVSPPDGFKLDADIFGLGVDVGVVHIRNLRFIIQGYLEGAYGYSERDAAILAEYITVYNAVYRGDWEFFSSRYKAPVMYHLTAERAGISVRYDEWPGQTLMLIPLGSGLGGPLSAIDTGAISDARVTEALRQEPDMSLDLRRDMVDLREREADQAAQIAEETREAVRQEETRIAEEREQAREQQQQAREELQQIAQERQQPGADQEALAQREADAREQQRQAQQQQEELARREQELEEQRREAERQDAFAEQRLAEAQQERRQIAEDMQTVIDRMPPRQQLAGIFAVSIIGPGSPLGRLVRLDANTGAEIMRSPLNTINVNTITQIDNRIFAIAGENRGPGAIRLVEISPDSLEMLRQGNDDITPQSLLWLNGEYFYAVINSGGTPHLARFNNELAVQARSNLPVHQFASVLFSGDYIITQRSDGSALLLNTRDLNERRR